MYKPDVHGVVIFRSSLSSLAEWEDGIERFRQIATHQIQVHLCENIPELLHLHQAAKEAELLLHRTARASLQEFVSQLTEDLKRSEQVGQRKRKQLFGHSSITKSQSF